MPLSWKLMLTTSIVVAAAVSASAWFGQRTIRELAREDAAARKVRGERAIVRESELLARNLAAASRYALAQQAYGEIAPLLASTIREYPRIQWVIVADEAGQIVAATEGAPPATFDGTPDRAVTHRRVAPAEWRYATAIHLDDKLVGQLRMGVTTADLEAELSNAIAAADRRARDSMRTVWLVALALLAVGLGLAALQGVSMAMPLRQLAVLAQRIGDGHLDQRVPETRRDEIGVLARELNRMATRLAELMVEQARKAMLERELDLARSVQQGMLPAPELVEHGALKILGYCEPASSCGGDWWTFRRMSGGRMLLVIGDATGHGVHSAILAGTARGAVQALAEVDEQLLTPELVLKAIDAAIRNTGERALLMTAFAALFDSTTGVVQYANAGQNFPYVMRMRAGRTLGDATILAASGNPLGDPSIKRDIRRGSIQLRPGDLFVAFTDGVVERQAPSGKLFGDRRLRSVFAGRELPAEPAALPALREDVRAAVHRFASGTVVQDDITFVLCHFDPPLAGEQPAREAAR